MKQYLILLVVLVFGTPVLVSYTVVSAVRAMLRALTFALLNDADKAMESVTNLMK